MDLMLYFWAIRLGRWGRGALKFVFRLSLHVCLFSFLPYDCYSASFACNHDEFLLPAAQTKLEVLNILLSGIEDCIYLYLPGFFDLLGDKDW